MTVVMEAGAVVCRSALLEGDVVVGRASVVHPVARLRAAAGGRVQIGPHCEISERALVEASAAGDVTVIGESCVLGVGCMVQSAARLGARCQIGPLAVVGGGASLGDDCVLGARCTIAPGEHLSSGTVVYGEGHRRQRTSRPPLDEPPQLPLLRETLPKYHNLRDSGTA